MSARGKIHRFFKENRDSISTPCDPETGYFVDDPEGHLDELLDAYAELVEEEIRRRPRASALDSDFGAAADLISRSPGRNGE